MYIRQILALLICNVVPFTIGYGLLPLLPVYASKLGADPLLIGYYLSFAFLALAVGTIVAGWLSDKLQRRKILLILASIVVIPAIWFMGRAINIWHLALLSAIVWFLSGVEITIISILTGLFAKEAKRGRIFGLLGMTRAIAFIIGGFTSGPIADRWGYAVMFSSFAIFSIIVPITGVILKEKMVEKPTEAGLSVRNVGSKIVKAVLILVFATLFARVASFVGDMGRSLRMNEIGFSSTAISSTASAIGIVMLPLPFLFGWLSDRIGRKRLLIICYLACSFALVVLAVSVHLWQFWIFASLMAVFNVNNSIGSAFVTDLAPKESLGLYLSLFRSASWVGAVFGFLVAGYSFQNLGLSLPLLIGSILPILGFIFLLVIREPKISK